MKKKVILILITLVLAATLLAATACDEGGMIVKNQKRNFTQLTAKISYADRASEINKVDLNATINNFVLQYYNYYQNGYLSADTYQAVLKNIGTSYKQANESLAESEAYTLKCIDELYKQLLESGDETKIAAAKAASTAGKKYSVSARIKEIESILSEKDLIAAVKAYNEEMQEGFDSFREAYEKEIENATATSASLENVESVEIVSTPWKLVYEVGESLNESGLKVVVHYKNETTVELDRDEFTVTGFSSDSVAEDQEITVTFSDKTATFTVDIIKALPSRPALPTDDEEEEEEEDTTLPALFEVDLEAKIAEAKSEDPALYKVLKEAKRRFEKQLDENYRTYEYYYLSKLKAQAVTAYEEYVSKDAETVSSEEIVEEFNKKLESQLEKLNLGTSKYSDILDDGIADQIVRGDDEYFYVYNLLFKLTDDLQAKYDDFDKEGIASDAAKENYLNYLINQIGVYVSNPAYDKDAKCEEEDCTCTACVNYTGENPGECELDPEECTCKKCPNKRFITEKYAEEHGIALNEKGAINVLDMLEAVYSDLGEVEPTEEGRAAILKKFEELVYMANDDEGFFTTISSKLGYGLSNSDSSYVKSFTELSRALANGATGAETLKYHIVGSGVGSYGYCITNYGIHVVMLAAYALPEEYQTEQNKIAGTDYYAFPMDAARNYLDYEEAEDGDLPKGTFAYEIKESLGETKKQGLIDEFKKDFYQNDLPANAKISYYKVYQDLIDQYK